MHCFIAVFAHLLQTWNSLSHMPPKTAKMKGLNHLGIRQTCVYIPDFTLDSQLQSEIPASFIEQAESVYCLSAWLNSVWGCFRCWEDTGKAPNIGPVPGMGTIVLRTL